MSYLLDTNAVSEWTKPKADLGLAAWLAETPEYSIYLSVATLAELRFGIDLLPDGKRRGALSAWLERDLPARFEDRILDVTRHVADRCGSLQVISRHQGKSLHAMDALIAATSQIHGFTLVTRNVRDFTGIGLAVLNPWSSR